MRTGPESGLVVLDIDPRNGGEKSLAKLVAKHGSLPETVEDLTGGGGRHLYFRYPDNPVKSGSSKLGEGLDVKADGGYVVAAPSLHASGNHYEWKLGHGPDECEPAPLPDWLLEKLSKSKQEKPATAPSPREPEGIIPEGQRNKTLTSNAGVMRRKGMLQEAIEAALLAENARCEPPLSEGEVKRIAQSVGSYPPGPAKICQLVSEPPHQTDLGNAKRLVKQHGADLRYCGVWGKWLVWDGRRWEVDQTGEVERRAKDTVREIYCEAGEQPDEGRRKELADWAKRSESHSRIEYMIDLAKTEPEIVIKHDELDRNPWLLNVGNGTLDLKTGQLRPHRREDLISKLAPLDYYEHATCPTWEGFLRRIMGNNKGLIRFLQRAVGYSLTGDTSEQVVFFLHGRGANGKSTFLELIRAALGDYAQQSDPSTFLVKRGDGPRNDLARLKGARLVAGVEVEEGRLLAETLVKQLTGGDTITTRFMYKEYFEYKPTFKIFLAANAKPTIRGQDQAIWRRIRLVPFEVSIPPSEQDKKLAEKLKMELPGILSWAVEGCLAWQREGLGMPEEVARATEEYRNEMDELGGFIADCCVAKPEMEVPSADLYQAYREWADSNGERNILQQNVFGMRLRERGFESAKIRGKRGWKGIGLLAQ